MRQIIETIKLDIGQYQNQLNRWQGPIVRMGDVTLDVAFGSVSGSPGEVARAIYVGGTGDISIINLDGNTVIFSGVSSGDWFYVVCTQVNSSGTTATDLVWGS